MNDLIEVTYDITNDPIRQKFHASKSVARGISGPSGSGKSSSCIWEMWLRISEQAPNKDNIRKSKWAVIGPNYEHMIMCVIPEVISWIPEVDTIGYHHDIALEPIMRSFIRYTLEDRTEVQAEIYYISGDLPKYTTVFESLELTGAWITSAHDVPPYFFDSSMARIFRFPSKREGGPSWSGVIADASYEFPEHSWWFNRDIERFNQPDAIILEEGKWIVNPDAENQLNLVDGYYKWCIENNINIKLLTQEAK